MNAFDMIQQIGFKEVLRAYGYHADVRSRKYTHSQIIEAIDEYIAGNARLKDQDGYRRDVLEKVNLAIMDDILAEIDQAQDKFEESVTIIPDWEAFVVALMLYYATLAIISSRMSRVIDEDIFARSWNTDIRFMQKWIVNGSREETDSQWQSRAKLYGGNARGAAFRAWEDGYAASAHYSGQRGFVAQYIAVGDNHTCTPCEEAQGFYLLTQGPFPGMVCKGRSRCRCRRIVTWAPDIYQNLINTPVVVDEETVW